MSAFIEIVTRERSPIPSVSGREFLREVRTPQLPNTLAVVNGTNREYFLDPLEFACCVDRIAESVARFEQTLLGLRFCAHHEREDND
jgi:hypothetical protein